MCCFRSKPLPPQVPKPPNPNHPSVFGGTIKILLHFGPRNSGLGEILRQIIELPNLDFSRAKNRPASLGDLHTDVFFLPRRHGCHVYTPPPPSKKKAGALKRRPEKIKRQIDVFLSKSPLKATSNVLNNKIPWQKGETWGLVWELPWI